MDILKAEIEKRKRKQNETPIDDGATTKKYVKRGELEKEREKKYFEEMEAERQRKDEIRRKVTEEEERRMEQIESLTKKKPQKSEVEDNLQSYLENAEEVIRRLRVRGQVVTFFGETDEERAKRLQKLEELEPIGYLGGSRDEFGQQLRKLEAEQEADKPNMQNGEKQPEEKREEVSEDRIPQATTREIYILAVLKKLMRLWNQELQDRPETLKRTAQGKIETATFKQTKSHIKPLIKQLKSRSLSTDILNPMFDIATHLEDREYVKAHDSYLKMAIGNAPWPMGVTMVGIHERSSREKIFSSQVAHVLNDETQRKYIQSVKRLMTYCQSRFPTDPSKTVG